MKSEFELTIDAILDAIYKRNLDGAVFITGHTDPDGTYHNFIMYQPIGSNGYSHHAD